MAIRGHQRPSEAIRGHQKAIKRQQKSSEVISTPVSKSATSAGTIRGHQWSSVVIRSHQHTCLEERHECRYATRRSDGHSVAVKLGE